MSWLVAGARGLWALLVRAVVVVVDDDDVERVSGDW
jgi:hypothetical protein